MSSLTNMQASGILSLLARKNRESFDSSAKKSISVTIPSRLNQKTLVKAFPKWKRSHEKFQGGNTWMKNGRKSLRYDQPNY